MIIEAIAFYVFAVMIVASSVMVISARNPVHSVLFLILAFFNGAGLFVLAGAEFIAMITSAHSDSGCSALPRGLLAMTMQFLTIRGACRRRWVVACCAGSLPIVPRLCR